MTVRDMRFVNVPLGLSESSSIHPIHRFSVPLIRLHGVTGSLEPVPGDLGHKTGDTLDGVATHHRAIAITHAFRHYG